MNKPAPLELQFTARLPALTTKQKRSLNHWLRLLLLASSNGHPARVFYIVNPTGGMEML